MRPWRRSDAQLPSASPTLGIDFGKEGQHENRPACLFCSARAVFARSEGSSGRHVSCVRKRERRAISDRKLHRPPRRLQVPGILRGTGPRPTGTRGRVASVPPRHSGLAGVARGMTREVRETMRGQNRRATMTVFELAQVKAHETTGHALEQRIGPAVTEITRASGLVQVEAYRCVEDPDAFILG